METALASGLAKGLFKQGQEPIVRATVTGILHHPELVTFFDPENTVLNEQAIIRPGATNVKPDRMVLTPDSEILLLDYKTGAHRDSYVDQLAEYERAISQMGFRVRKKVLVYTGREVNVINLQNNLT